MTGQVKDNIQWLPQGWEDYLHWQEHNTKNVASINDLIADIRRDPFRGLGKPEGLKHDLHGWWSRRITKEDRLVYRVYRHTQPAKGHKKPIEVRVIQIAQARFHYVRTIDL